MDKYLQTHTWMCCESAWGVAHLTFEILCVLAALLAAVWIVGVVVSAYVHARQAKAQRRRRASTYRVGGAVNP